MDGNFGCRVGVLGIPTRNRHPCLLSFVTSVTAVIFVGRTFVA